MDDETRRVGEIEAEIAETRVELSETIEAIQERLAPANIVANATDTVRHAATEKVRQMADNSFVDRIRENPIPAAMIGIGAAWLYFKGRSEPEYGFGSSRDYPRNVQRYRTSYGDLGGTAEYAVGTRGRRYGTATDEDYDEGVGSMGRDVASRTREMADNVGDSAREMIGDVRDTARQTTRRAQLKFNDVLRDNPLMLGAAAALIGAAVGMSIPATETENQFMGEARDAVVDRAQHLASDAANQVSEAAGDVQQAAGRVADTASNIASSTSSEGSGSDMSSVGTSSGTRTSVAGRRRSPGGGTSQS
jgi:hypothetical protein